MEDHSRTIIHIDIDCFYAQVEMVKNPNLRNQPLGIKQKNIIVTSNYVAREYGITKCMLISDAKKVCPNLELVNGEDLHDYRQISYKLTSLLHNYSELVERLGLDENYVDVTKLVSEKQNNTLHDKKLVGYVYGNTDILCDCGCTERLTIGSEIAQEIRDVIYNELKLTTCAGIAHNKLLSKIVCAKNKPNKQTVVFPNSASELMFSLNLIKNIPYIGSITTDQLSKININTIEDLQNCNLSQLEKVFGLERAKHIMDSSFGRETLPVKKTGKPQSIGLEDSCRTITAEKEIEAKLKQLLLRLMVLVKEDGRLPKTVKLTVRKFNKSHLQNATRETRQCNINTALFKNFELTEANQIKLMKIIMTLFRKIVDVKRSFHITLLGLSFTKFVVELNTKNTLMGFLTRNIEVQSVTDIESQSSGSPIREPSTSSIRNENTDSPEPRCKRGKFFDFNCVNATSDSPNKLSVATLRLNSTESPPEASEENIPCPPDTDEEVFRALPNNIQGELWEDYKRNRERSMKNERPVKKSKPNSILNYLNKTN